MIISSGWWTLTRYKHVKAVSHDKTLYELFNKQDGVINVEEELNLEIRNTDCNGNGFGGYISSAYS